MMVKPDKTFFPNPGNSKRYSEMYDIYCRIYEGLEEMEVFKSLAKIRKKF